MQEIWKEIEGTNGVYEVSNLGRVKSHRFRGHDKVDLLKPYMAKRYQMVRLYRPTRKEFLVHQLVARAFLDNPRELREVNHIDGDPANNRVDNLEWVTHQENMGHSIRTGLSDAAEAARIQACEDRKKPVRVVSPAGETHEFPSAIEAINTLGLTRGLYSVLENKSKTHFGYTARYIGEGGE